MTVHLDMHEIFRLAMVGDRHEHLDTCAFCRDEYENAMGLLAFESSPGGVEKPGSPVEGSRNRYRLAAQDNETTAADTFVRKTWYLDEGAVVLRVMEDPRRAVLYGHLIAEPGRYAALVVRFDGIEGDFRPDRDGVFEIGPSTIEIERMDVLLVSG